MREHGTGAGVGNAVGSWKVTMTTPAGPQDMRLSIDCVGEAFSGRIESALGNHDITGKVVDGTLNWVMKASKPIPITVTFTARIEGDALSGSAKLGFLGKSTLSGTRIRGDEAPSMAAPAEEDGPLFVTGDSVDPRYREPYVDVNELRSEPVPHRYVHGGFKGTDARFSFYFPPAEQYQGRFFQNTYPMALSEDVGPFPIEFEVSTGNLPFTFASGAYYVQTNLGGNDRAGGMADPAIAAWRVNAAAAKYSRVVAAELYGAHRPYGYIFGGSGGSYQVIGCAENTEGVWDGFVPFVMATPNAIPSMFTVRMHALRVLRKRQRLAAIADALDAGGSGDPLAELNDEERAAFTEITRMGYPLRGWWNHAELDSGYFMQVAPLVPMLDADYVEDFWRQPGYLGSDPAAGLAELRYTFDTTVSAVIDGFPRQLELAAIPDRDFSDAHLCIQSGESAGRSIPIARSEGQRLRFAYAADQAALNAIRVGDRVRIDNAWALAVQTYHRHQLPEPDQYAWDQFRDAQGKPRYPQRPMLIGPLSAIGTAGALPKGQIKGRMLVLQCLSDIDALPWQADWYRSLVQTALGERFEDHFALWYIENAQHDNPQTPLARAHIVSFEGALQQALRDVAAWAERGVRPSSTRYRIEDAQVIVPRKAHERLGIQPVVQLRANGSARAEVKVGEPVQFSATVEVPDGMGKIVAAEWDFASPSAYHAADLATRQTRLQLEATHRYERPGTYFAVLRVSAQREGNGETPFCRIQNLARVRVVVS